MARVDRQIQDDLHRRVMARDPTAKADAFETLLVPLIELLGYRWPGLRASEQLRDQAIDSIFHYLGAPERYDPKQCSLLTYLRMDAHGDLLNAYRASGQALREVPLPPEVIAGVRDPAGPRKIDPALTWTDTYPSDSGLPDLIREVEAALPAERDRKILALLLRGERATKAYAQVLGISHLSLGEQERLVNREKDRLRKRLRRLGERHEKKHGA